jgi:hypothetical protein
MTMQEFLEVTEGEPPIQLIDGRMGLITSWTEELVLVTIPGEENHVELPWARLAHVGGGAFAERPA